MPRQRRTGFGVTRAPRRQIANNAFTAEIDGVVTVIGIVKSLFSGSLAVVESALTLVRTRGEFGFRIAAAAAGNSITRGAFGMIVTSSDAVIAGVASVPGPLSDSLNDWFVWVPFTVIHNASSQDAEYNFRPFDSRGMRKLKFGEDLVPVLEIESDVAGSSIDASFSLRIQSKL